MENSRLIGIIETLSKKTARSPIPPTDAPARVGRGVMSPSESRARIKAALDRINEEKKNVVKDS